MTQSQYERLVIPCSVLETVLKRLEIAGPLLQDTGSLCRAVRQGIATEMEEARLFHEGGHPDYPDNVNLP